MTRKQVYTEMSRRLGREFHAAETVSIEEVNQCIDVALALQNEVAGQ